MKKQIKQLKLDNLVEKLSYDRTDAEKAQYIQNLKNELGEEMYDLALKAFIREEKPTEDEFLDDIYYITATLYNATIEEFFIISAIKYLTKNENSYYTIDIDKPINSYERYFITPEQVEGKTIEELIEYGRINSWCEEVSGVNLTEDVSLLFLP